MYKLLEQIPALAWIKDYNKTTARFDLIAAITVASLLIPQAMAYAMLAGVPPSYGLLSCIVPLVFYCLFASSRHLIVSPIAVVSLLIAGGVVQWHEPFTHEYTRAVLTLALLVGVIQLLLGVFKAGFIVNLLSMPVIKGFTMAAALIIGVSQLKYLSGIDAPRSSNVILAIRQLFSNMDTLQWQALLLGILSLIILIIGKRFFPGKPAALFLLIISMVVTYSTSWFQIVPIVGYIESDMPGLALPDMQWETIKNLFPLAIVISFVGFTQSVALGNSLRKKHKNYRIIPRQELKALGIASIVGSFFQSMPVHGSLAGSATNEEAGARTNMSGIMVAGIFALSLLLVAPVFFYIPMAALSAIILLAVVRLLNLREIYDLWKMSRRDCILLLITMLGTLLVGIADGILLGIIFSIILLIYRSMQPNMVELGRLKGTTHYRDISRYPDVEINRDILVVRIDVELNFTNINLFREMVEQKVKARSSRVKLIILNANGIGNIDTTAMETLEEIVEEYRQQYIHFYFAGVRGPVRDQMERSGFPDRIGTNHFFLTIQEAVDFWEEDMLYAPNREYALQTNIGKSEYSF